MAGALADHRVTVVGAGIGGLTAALALARRGARVTVLEQAPDLAEVGAGIQLSPNAVRVLDALGLRADLEGEALRNRAVQLHDARGKRVLRMDLLAHRPQAPFLLVHRARLIALLASAAARAGAVLRLGQVVEARPRAPLVVAADGLKSRLRVLLNGREVPFFTGQVAWRALIPDQQDALPEAWIFMGPGCHLVSYPLPGGLRNIVAVQEQRAWHEEGWSHPADPRDLRAAFDVFGAPVAGWLSAAGHVHRWGLFRHQVAARWQGDGLALLGDAAHPTLPFLAQGAAMAIEDAWTLAACLDANSDQEAALSRYQALRQPRATRIVEAANANARNFHLRGPRRVLGHAALRLVDHVMPSLMQRRLDWLYDHDPVAGLP